jgi:hypothetical protein
MNDDVEQFKRDLLSLNWHLQQMEEISLELEELNYRMTGAGCVPISRVSPTVSPSERSNLGLIEKKDKLLEEYRTHARMAENVRQALSLVDPESRGMLENKYIKRVPNLILEKQYGYTASSINRICNKIIRTIIFKSK